MTDLIGGVRAFVAVVECGGVTAGAQMLGVPQPTVSRQLARLEAALGVRLLERSTRAARLTDVGEVAFGAGLGLLAAEDAFRRRVESAAAGVHELLVPRGLDPTAMATIALRARAGGLGLAVREAPLAERETALRTQSTDAVLLPATADHVDWEVELGVAAPDLPSAATFPLDVLRPTRGLDPRAWSAVVMLAEDAAAPSGEIVRQHVADSGLAAAQVMVAETAGEALSHVLGGDGVLWCSQWQAETWGLAWAPVADLPLARTYRLATREPELRARLLTVCANDLARALRGPHD